MSHIMSYTYHVSSMSSRSSSAFPVAFCTENKTKEGKFSTEQVLRVIITCDQGRTQGGVLGLNPPLSLIFYKNFITFARRLSVFAYFLLVNLST